MPAASESSFRITLTIDGENWGVWDKKSGGNMATNASAYPPGGMGDPYVLSGTPQYDPITLSRNYRYARDHDRLPDLKAKRGLGWCVVKTIPLTPDGNTYGIPETRQGLLTAVQTPDVDSTSSTDAQLAITIQPGVQA